MTIPQWAIVYHANGDASSKRWYRVSRVIEADGKTFELYWHPQTTLRGKNKQELKNKANILGVDLMPVIFRMINGELIAS
jgi:hypothetical protein